MKMKDYTKCEWCGVSDGDPMSGEALLGSLKTIHAKCYTAFNRSDNQSQRVMGVLNDFFAKEIKRK